MCEDCLSFAVVAAEFWSLRKKCGSQRTNRVRQTLVAPACTSRARVPLACQNTVHDGRWLRSRRFGTERLPTVRS